MAPPSDDEVVSAPSLWLTDRNRGQAHSYIYNGVFLQTFVISPTLEQTVYPQKRPKSHDLGLCEVAYDSIFQVKFPTENNHLAICIHVVLFVGFRL